MASTSSETQSSTHAQSKWLSKSAAQTRGSDTEEVQFHYDISNEFFKLWQDPTQTYSCAYFERDDMSLEEAQMAKVDLALGKLGLQPGMTLLDIGCGWGSTIMRAVDKYDVNVIGLTLSANQKQHIEDYWFANSDSPRSMEVRLQPWEEFDEPVDRVVSIGAFEHFGFNKYDDYFKRTFNLMPDDGVMLLHTIIIPSDEEIQAKKLPLTMSRVRFIKFIMDEIYPGGRLPLAAQVEGHAVKAGFTVTRKQHLQPHYARTLDTWTANLESKKDEAIAITSEQIYERFMKYLTGCADLFRNGYTDVCQFTCEKALISRTQPQMADSEAGSTTMRPYFEEIQAHYDLSDDFFGVFQDPSRTYSCAFYEREDMTLGEAQMAKIDLALGKLELEPGMTLLDVGCGWGSVMKRAVEDYDVNVVGLTLSNNQSAYAQTLLDHIDTDRSRQVFLRGWEQVDEPVDRIVSIEAFEAFPQERYAAFFEMTYRILPQGGRMVLQTIMGHPLKRWPEMGIPITMSDLKFMRFIAKEIFPGGSIPCDEDIVQLSSDAGFSVDHIDRLNQHYVRTLDTWAENLEARRGEAIAATSEEVYQRYMRYLTGCADFFRRGICELGQFTLTK